VSRDRDAQVARDAQDDRPIVVGIVLDQDDRVGALADHRGRAPELLLLRRRQTGATIAPQHQEVARVVLAEGADVRKPRFAGTAFDAHAQAPHQQRMVEVLDGHDREAGSTGQQHGQHAGHGEHDPASTVTPRRRSVWLGDAMGH